MRVKDKKLLLLKSLYIHKFDGKMHDVNTIVKDGTFSGLQELSSIAKALSDEGLVKIAQSKSSVHAEITLDGVEYLEEGYHEEDLYQPNDFFNPIEKDVVIKKLDEFSERINKMELGQQIIYDDFIEEMNTMKQLLDVLGKKDWQQILKGKLIDAGLGSITSKVLDILIETFKTSSLLN